MARRRFTNLATPTTLNMAGGIDAAVTVLTVASTTGFPNTYPFTLAIERGTSQEEVMECTASDATHFTVTRGVDGTTAKAHVNGVTIEHAATARDYDEPNDFINKMTTKGDLLTRDGSGVVRVGVGADGLPIVALASNPNGWTWAKLGTAGIADDAITALLIAPNAVGNSEMADNAVGTTEILNGAVTQPKAPTLIKGPASTKKIVGGTAIFNVGAGGAGSFNISGLTSTDGYVVMSSAACVNDGSVWPVVRVSLSGVTVGVAIRTPANVAPTSGYQFYLDYIAIGTE